MFDINFKTTAIILLLISILSTIYMLASTMHRIKLIKNNPEQAEQTKKTFNNCNRTAFVIFVLTILGIAILFASYNIATKHGLYTTDLTINQLYNGIKNTPVEDKLPEDTSGCIILFYKFGCKDCEAIYNELLEYTKNKPKIYWVSSRSEQGKALLENYPIESVPTGIYIHTNSDKTRYTKKSLYYTSNSGDILLDKTAIDRLLYLQEQNR